MNRHTPTLAEVAQIAGVTTMTVSRALNNRPGVSQAKRAEILRIVDDLGYVLPRPGEKRTRGRSRIIAVVTPELYSPFVNEVVTGAGRAARAAGYEMLVYSLTDSALAPPASVLSLIQQSAAGLVAVLPRQFRYLDGLAASQLPIITVEHRGEHTHFPSVLADNYAGAWQAMTHLASLGHRRIAFVTGDDVLASARERLRAYQDAVVRLELEQDAALICRGDFSMRSGQDAARSLLALARRPSAIFAASDVCAFGVIAALCQAGLSVPADISVVGFDDIPAASQTLPALTTVRQPMRQMGRAAVTTLLAVMAGIEAPEIRVSLPTELVLRQTAAPVEASKSLTTL